MTHEEMILEQAERGRHLVPPHMWDSVKLYLVNRIPAGSFMTALFSNDLMGAFGRADEVNARAMQNWAQFIYNYTPSSCHGSPEAVRDWLNPEKREAA